MGQVQLPHLHLHVGVGKVVLGRQFAVVVDEMVQDGGAQDGLQPERSWTEGRGCHKLKATAVPLAGQNKVRHKQATSN